MNKNTQSKQTEVEYGYYQIEESHQNGKNTLEPVLIASGKKKLYIDSQDLEPLPQKFIRSGSGLRSRGSPIPQQPPASQSTLANNKSPERPEDPTERRHSPKPSKIVDEGRSSKMDPESANSGAQHISNPGVTQIETIAEANFKPGESVVEIASEQMSVLDRVFSASKRIKNIISPDKDPSEAEGGVFTSSGLMIANVIPSDSIETEFLKAETNRLRRRKRTPQKKAKEDSNLEASGSGGKELAVITMDQILKSPQEQQKQKSPQKQANEGTPSQRGSPKGGSQRRASVDPVLQSETQHPSISLVHERVSPRVSIVESGSSLGVNKRHTEASNLEFETVDNLEPTSAQKRIQRLNFSEVLSNQSSHKKLKLNDVEIVQEVEQTRNITSQMEQMMDSPEMSRKNSKASNSKPPQVAELPTKIAQKKGNLKKLSSQESSRAASTSGFDESLKKIFSSTISRIANFGNEGESVSGRQQLEQSPRKAKQASLGREINQSWSGTAEAPATMMDLVEAKNYYVSSNVGVGCVCSITNKTNT